MEWGERFEDGGGEEVLFTLIPSGSSPVHGSSDMCSNQQGASMEARELNMLIVPHSRCLKDALAHGLPCQISNPVVVAPGMIATGYFFRRPLFAAALPGRDSSSSSDNMAYT